MSTANNQVSHIDFKFLKDTGLQGTASTERDNAFGAGGKLYSVFINGASAGAQFFLKLYDKAGAVDETSDFPDFQFKLDDAQELLQFPEGITFSNGLGYTVSTNAGRTNAAISAAANPTVFTFK
tara:strand:- start:8882 stop:9253 length:372 start_codon:yes stop_codon:yes gene_type:complete